MADSSKPEASKAETLVAAVEKPVEKVEASAEAQTASETPEPAAPAPIAKDGATDETTASTPPAAATAVTAVAPETNETTETTETTETKTETKSEEKTESNKPDEVAAATTASKETKAPTPAKTPFAEFGAKLPEILNEVGHDEMWGVKLTSASSDVPTSIVLQKFLNANDGELTKAIAQFKGALKFRKEKKPLELVTKTFNAKKFSDLGAVTVYPVKDSTIPDVFTWNLYGNVKDKMDEVFVPLEEFMDYRIALQELGIQQLKLSSATEPITADKDPYKIIQVHDYKSISFFRQNPNVKAASTEVIKQFSLAYPELLKEKFFVNVPAIMGWMYSVIKLFVAPKTAKKFHPMANSANLAAEFKTGGLDATQLPKEYGGTSGSGDGKMKDITGLVNSLKFE